MTDILGNKNSIGSIENVGLIPIIDNGYQNCLFTIGIPTFNRVNDLKEALDSVYSQLGDIEYNVLVVDNNSERNDETETFLQAGYSRKAFFSYYKNVENIGMAGNWNRLFQLAHTPYLIMLHDDDYLFSDFLIYMNELLRCVPDASVINSKKKSWDGIVKESLVSERMPKAYILHTVKSNLYSFETKAPSGCLFKVSDVYSAGGFDNDTYPSIDYVFILKLLLENKTIVTTTDTLMLYREVNNASSKESTLKKWVEFEYDLKTELCNKLKLCPLHRSFVVSYAVKYWLYCLKSQYGVNDSYKGIKRGGKVFLCFFIAFQFIYQHIYINCFRGHRL